MQTEYSNILGCQACILPWSLPLGSNQGTALREDGCLFLPVKPWEPMFSQGAKNFLSSWVPISFETAGVSDPGLGMWFVSPWNLRVKRECAPSPSQANSPLPLRFFYFFSPIEVLYLRSMAHGWDHYAYCKILMSGDGYIVLGRGSFVFIIFSKE